MFFGSFLIIVRSHEHIGSVSSRVSQVMDKLRSSNARALQGRDRSGTLTDD